jgi:4-hydroxybenzoate polyprenyltransferase
LKKTIKGLAKLTRFCDYGYYVMVPSLLGVAAAKGSFSWQLLLVLLANWMAVGFAYMVNDIEDAPDDAFSTNRVKSNPISSGLVAPKTARIAALLMGLSAAISFAGLGVWPFIFGMISLTFGFLYSVKYVQLKSMAFLILSFIVCCYLDYLFCVVIFLSPHVSTGFGFGRLCLWSPSISICSCSMI